MMMRRRKRIANGSPFLKHREGTVLFGGSAGEWDKEHPRSTERRKLQVFA